MNLNESDRLAIRSAIEKQLQAFQQDDAAQAFVFASPDIQDQFRTPENFMQMVKNAYQAVYRPRSVLFENLTLIKGIPAQPVLLLDAKGSLAKAIYLMEKQADSSWRIHGCYLVEVEPNKS